jgi:hypothetical protein
MLKLNWEIIIDFLVTAHNASGCGGENIRSPDLL